MKSGNGEACSATKRSTHRRIGPIGIERAGRLRATAPGARRAPSSARRRAQHNARLWPPDRCRSHVVVQVSLLTRRLPPADRKGNEPVRAGVTTTRSSSELTRVMARSCLWLAGEGRTRCSSRTLTAVSTSYSCPCGCQAASCRPGARQLPAGARRRPSDLRGARQRTGRLRRRISVHLARARWSDYRDAFASRVQAPSVSLLRPSARERAWSLPLG
jgi:hypothetical protein